MTNQENKIAKLLQAVGILAISIGLAAGIYVMSVLDQGSAGVSLMMNGAIAGLLFFGFAETIKLLQGIYNQGEERLGRKAEVPAGAGPASGDPDPVSSVERGEGVSPAAASRLDQFYARRGRSLEAVRRTDVPDVYLTVVDGQKELAEMNVLTPQKVSDDTLRRHPELQKLLDGDSGGR